MFDLKKKALQGIQSNLDDRLAKRLTPEPVNQGDTGEEPGEDPREEASETPMQEHAEDRLENELPDGADVSKLSPEERQQLESLYAKMGC